ncbi:MAG: hypothetical protein ACETVX_02425 [bacterium]|nr:S1/P1 nuclease [candidate division WOR-3 bacterium]
MKQRAHAWVTLRVYKLLDDSKKTPKLIELLSYYLSDVWKGAWLPDTQLGDMRYGHIYKMDSDPKMLGLEQKEMTDRFSDDYKTLKANLKGKRLCLDYIKDSDELDKPYRSHPEKGGHLPDRVLALSHTIADMLKLSDYPIPFYVKGKSPRTYKDNLSGQTIKNLSLSPNFSARQIALMFFMLSHYICDAHMPLHCDLRDYGGKGSKTRRLPDALHPAIEETWEEWFPVHEKLALHDYTKKTVDEIVMDFPPETQIEIDKNETFELNPEGISKVKRDVWREMVYITRISYAVSRKWLPTKSYPNAKKPINDIGEKEFKDVTNRIFHDTVESIARIWFNVWETFKK